MLHITETVKANMTKKKTPSEKPAKTSKPKKVAPVKETPKEEEKEKPVDRRVVRDFSRSLPTDLTEDELMSVSRKMASRSKDLEDLHAEKAAEMRRLGEDIKRMTGEISRYGYIIRTGKEDREIDCQEVAVLKDRTIATIRLDNGEEISERPMTTGERQEYFQEKLFPDENGNSLSEKWSPSEPAAEPREVIAPGIFKEETPAA